MSYFRLLGISVFFYSINTYAASFEGSLIALTGTVVSRILPILAAPYVAKTIFGYIQGDPEAVRSTPKVVFGVIALLGFTGVWEFLKAQVK